ncbi:MAG: glutamate--cysteine ligase [Gemmatimonadetes bacterium]|nr:glutamate--cysteine ligase [Gemmatimonadota bacterium]
MTSVAISPERFAALRDGIHRRSFAPAVDARRVGAEVELIAYDAATNVPLPLLDARRGLIRLLRRHAPALGWTERQSYSPVPGFDIGGEAIVSFEPGGQIEISSAACPTASALVALLRDSVAPLRSALAADGVRLDSVGIDPFNDAPSIPQQLPLERYERMTEYFERIGPFGIRMMRQTAAIQVSLDRGPHPATRWRLLNDLAPYLTAIFANSTHYLGVDTGHRSYRANCWRMLDPTRTGVALPHEDPAAAYTRFALGANDMMRVDADGTYRSFGEWLAADSGNELWENHLTTLFPEVRPRGHYEVRSCDAIDPDWYAVPIVILCGLAYDARAAAEAALLASESRALLRTAGERGLSDTAIARTARDLFQLALDGARRLGDDYAGSAEIDVAQQFYDQFTARDRTPADDVPPAYLARMRTVRSRSSRV